jgi:AraC-like DNA-binding protein
MQLPPHPLLTGLIKHYLILETYEDLSLNYRLFSDGNPGIVFHYKNPLTQYDGDRTVRSVQPKSFIYGQVSHYNDLTGNGKLGMLVVVLQPYGIYSLLGMPATELNNSIVQLSDLFGQEGAEVEEKVIGGASTEKKIQYIEKFFIKKSAFIKDPDPIFKESLFEIYKQQGLVTIRELLAKIPITERQLERKFREYTGRSPKQFSDTIKFQHFLKRLQTQAGIKKISDIIYDSGYYDPSHLNNYFKKMAGFTPMQYKSGHLRLANNFMQLSQTK